MRHWIPFHCCAVTLSGDAWNRVLNRADSRALLGNKTQVRVPSLATKPSLTGTSRCRNVQVNLCCICAARSQHFALGDFTVGHSPTVSHFRPDMDHVGGGVSRLGPSPCVIGPATSAYVRHSGELLVLQRLAVLEVDFSHGSGRQFETLAPACPGRLGPDPPCTAVRTRATGSAMRRPCPVRALQDGSDADERYVR